MKQHLLYIKRGIFRLFYWHQPFWDIHAVYVKYKIWRKYPSLAVKVLSWFLLYDRSSRDSCVASTCRWERVSFTWFAAVVATMLSRWLGGSSACWYVFVVAFPWQRHAHQRPPLWCFVLVLSVCVLSWMRIIILQYSIVWNVSVYWRLQLLFRLVFYSCIEKWIFIFSYKNLWCHQKLQRTLTLWSSMETGKFLARWP